MELQALEYFIAIAESESVSKAAERFHISQPAMSRALARLESEMNAPLFDRIGKKLRLNPRGESLLRSAQSAVRLLDDAAYYVRTLSGTPVGTVRIGVFAAASILSDCIAAYSKENPNVCFAADTHAASGSQGEYDILLESYPIDRPTYDYLPILHEKHVAILHKTHPLAKRAWIDLIELKEDRFVFYGHPDTPTGFDTTYSYCMEAGFTPKKYIRTDNTSVKPELVACGAAVGLVPEICIDGHRLAYPSMVFVPIRSPNTERTVYLGWRSDSYLSEAARSFKDFAVMYYRRFAAACDMDPTV